MDCLRELYFRTPASDPSLRNALLSIWIWAPSQFNYALELAKQEQTPATMEPLAHLLIDRGDPRGIQVLRERLSRPETSKLTEIIWGRIRNYGQGSTELQKLACEVASRDGDSLSRRCALECLVMKPEYPEHLRIVEAVLSNPSEDIELKKAAALQMPLDAMDELKFARYTSFVLPPSQPVEVRLLAIEQMTATMRHYADDNDAVLLPKARRTLEGLISFDDDAQVRSAAMQAAMRIWRSEADAYKKAALEAEEAAQRAAKRQGAAIPRKPALSQEQAKVEAERLTRAVREGLLTSEEALRQAGMLADPAGQMFSDQLTLQEKAYKDFLDSLRPGPEAVQEETDHCP